MKISPYVQVSPDLWRGKFGRFPVELHRDQGKTYWRGTPDDGDADSRIVLQTNRESWRVLIVGALTGHAQTLAGAMAHGERLAFEESGGAHHAPRYPLTGADELAERAALRLSRLDAIEADRRGAERFPGAALAMDHLPDLVELARAEGLTVGALERFAA